MSETGQIRDEQLEGEAEARRRVALAQIRQYPDPALRMRANDVDEFEQGLEQLVERMKHLLHDANGLGLAATQIGVLQRVFVFQTDPEVDPVALVNVTGRLQVGHAWAATLTLRNAFNATYADPGSAEHPEDAIVQDGRTFRVGLEWHFGG